MLKRAAVLLTLACVVPSAAIAAAQDAGAPAPTATEITVAREQFEIGVRAARARHWDEALAAFRRAYDLVPQPQMLLNLAGALVQTGHLVEGAEAYRRVLREAGPDLLASHGEAARVALDRVERRIARVTIVARGIEERDALLVDGNLASHALLGTSIPLDPGRHVMSVRRADRDVARSEVTLREGETARVELRVASPEQQGWQPAAPPRTAAPAPATQIEPRAEADRDERSSWLESPWTWVGAALVVAGAITAVVLITSAGPTEDAYVGNYPPGSVHAP